jgi:hypothetical protein
MCGRHDYMGFEPCPRCKAVGALAANVLVEARMLREIYEKSPMPLEATSLNRAMKSVVDAIRTFDTSPEARS